MRRQPTISEMEAAVQARRHPTRQAQPGFNEPGPIYGFVASALSAFPEFLGGEPAPSAAAFRAQHPVAGLVSELGALAIPYGAAFRLSRIPSMATRLESTVARVADPVLQPIRAGAVREMVRFAPLEASRLAIGGALYPDNFGELFADVAFAEGVMGAFGAVGGMFRAAGRATRGGPTRVVGADVMAAPTTQLQMLRAGGEVADPQLGREAAERLLVEEVFTETAGQGAVSKARLPTLAPLENARGREDWMEVNAHFSLSDAPETGVRRQLLVETPEQRLTTINPGEQEALVAELRGQGARVENIQDLASATFFPRLLTAVDKRGAGQLGRMLDRPVWTRVNDNLWLSREEGDGLFVGAYRLNPRARGDELDQAIDVLREAGERLGGKRRPRGAGGARVLPEDRFLLFKTNEPGRFAPREAQALERNYAIWAGWRQAYQEPVWELSRMGQVENELLRTLTPQDFRDLHRFSRQTMVSRLSERMTKRATGEAGLTDSASGRAVAEQLYDMMAPTMFKQGKNSLYARFELTMRARVREVERQLNRMFFGETDLAGRSLWKHIHRRRTKPAFAEGTWLDNWRSIPPDERELVMKAAITQTPADDLARLVDDGAVSSAAQQAIKNLQALDRRYLDDVVLPELKAAGLEQQFNLLEGYIMPVPRLGDFLQRVRDENGRVVAMVSGKNGAQANRQAQAIIEEAQRAGRQWQTTKAELMHTAELEGTEVDKLFAETMRQIGTDKGADDIVRDAMKRLRFSAHPTMKKNSGAPLVTGAPGSFKERTGLTTVIELPSEKEFLQQVRSHYERLGRYASMQGWSERWGGELQRFTKYEPTLAQDLLRKRAQYLGIEGQITNTLNKVLQPVLGGALGSKPATRIAQATNELMYNFNLAWVNPTFALLNSLTPIMTALPQIAFVMRGSAYANARLYQFVPTYGAAGRPNGLAATLSPLKVLWQSVRDLRDPSPEFRQMVKELTDDGSLHAQIAELLGPTNATTLGLRQSFNERGYLGVFHDWATYPARKSEEFSRMVSAAAGFRLGKDVLRLEGAQLKGFTRRFVETTNYMYGVVDRPRLFTGPIGSVFGLFKNWQMHYLGMMTHYAGLAWRENVWSPLLWQSGAALAIGGLGATPLRHVADGISNWYSGDPESYRWMMENWPNAADEIWFGLPAFLGVSLQTSSAIPGTDVRNEITSLGNVVAWERAKQLGTAVGAAFDEQRATGRNALENPNIRDQLLAALTPRVISRAISVTEGEYVRSMRTGYPQVRDVSPRARLLHGLGMNQVEVERQQDAAQELWKDQERRRAMITGLGAAYAQASLRGDGETMEQLIQRAVLLNIPLSSVMQSASNFERRETEGDALSRFDRVEAGRWQAALEASR